MISIIDYEVGNVISVKNALERLGEKVVLTNQKKKLKILVTLFFPELVHF